MAGIGIRLDAVTVSLSGVPVLRAVEWILPPEGHWAVLGPCGAGKSTLLRLLRGDLRPDQTPQGTTRGRVTWIIDGEEDTSPLAIKPVARLVSPEQQRTLARRGWTITGLEAILSSFTDSFLPSPADDAQIATTITVAERLGAGRLLEKRITAMSQGQLRLVLLARALASSPRLLLLDEPFDGLDAATRAVLHTAIAEAAKTATIIAASHREEDIPSCVTQAISLDRGTVASCGLYVPPRPAARAAAEPAVPDREACPPSPSPAVLELDSVDVYVDRAKVLHDITWSLPAGENWRIAGPNGSGKSTLLRLIAGFEHAALGGRLLWFGEEHPTLEKRLRETGYLSDMLHAAYTYDVTGEELVLSGFDGSVGLWRRQYGKEERDEACRWIDALELSAMARTPLSRMSSGTARRFFLARALVGPVRLLLLDEPCSGLDDRSREQFLAGVDTVLAAGVQCLYVTHHDTDLPTRVTHTLSLAEGRIVPEK